MWDAELSSVSGILQRTDTDKNHFLSKKIKKQDYFHCKKAAKKEWLRCKYLCFSFPQWGLHSLLVKNVRQTDGFPLVAGPPYLCQIKSKRFLCVTMDTMKILPSTNTIRGRQHSFQGLVLFCRHTSPSAILVPQTGAHWKRSPPGGRTVHGYALLCRSTWLWLGVLKKLA